MSSKEDNYNICSPVLTDSKLLPIRDLFTLVDPEGIGKNELYD